VTGQYQPSRLSFRSRLTLALLAAALLPLGVFGGGGLLIAGGDAQTRFALATVLLLTLTLTAIGTVMLTGRLAAALMAPIKLITRAVDRVSAGEPADAELTDELELPGDDDLARLGERHARLARDLARRNTELRGILDTLESTTLDEPPEHLATRAAAEARFTFGMIDCQILLGDPALVPEELVVPGMPVPVRAPLVAASQTLGVAVGRLPATRRWERADQDLFELFALEISAAIRNAQLYARVEEQNRRLVELDKAKDDFLRGVSHNLQTPLASIRGYAQQLAGERPDRRLGIVTEQADRLSRMVRQLLTVSRIESGVLRPTQEVFAPAALIRRAWEGLGAGDVAFRLDDRSGGWLAVGDPDQVDQVLWALLDNAVRYGGRTAITARVAVDAAGGQIAITIRDAGSGVPAVDRERLFARFTRGAGRPADEGSGLGLYVARGLCRAMGGELALEPADGLPGAAFTICLPAEEPGES
jgi:signal transduction histidine kinase